MTEFFDKMCRLLPRRDVHLIVLNPAVSRVTAKGIDATEVVTPLSEASPFSQESPGCVASILGVCYALRKLFLGLFG